MFTGIVQAQVLVKEVERRNNFVRLTLQTAPALLQQLQRGASIGSMALA